MNAGKIHPRLLPRLREAFLSAWRWWLAQPVSARFFWVLAAAAAGLLIFLLVAPKPWSIELTEDRRPGLADIVRVYSWYAASFNILVLAVLAATSRWWAAGGRLAREVLFSADTTPRPRWFVPAVCGAMLALALMAVPRLDYSLSHDEEYSVRRTILGQYAEREEGGIGLRRIGWRETLYYYVKPNNHVLHSMLSRIALGAWRLTAWSADRPFREWVIRLPAFAGGVLAVGALGWLIGTWVGPRSGALAAWILAIHPWMLRYTTEARGYSIAMLLIVVVLLLWWRALADGRWRWWLGLGAAQFALLYTYPAAVFVLIVLNGATALWLGWRALSQSAARVLLGRWFGVNSLAAVAAIQLMLPLAPQFQAFSQTAESLRPLGDGWHANTAAFFVSGMPWKKSFSNSSPHPELWKVERRAAAFTRGVLGATAAVIVLGAGCMLFGNARVRAACLVLILPAFLGYFSAVSQGQFLFEWYLIYLLPGLAAAAGVGLDRIARWIGRVPWCGLTGRVIAPLCVMVFAVFTQPARAWYLHHPIEPVKDSVLLVRASLDPNDPRHAAKLTASFNIPPYLYDAHSIRIQSEDEFLAVLERSDREGIPLVMNVGSPWSAAFNTPRLWRLFNESGLFQNFRYLYGAEWTFDRVIADYAPGALAGFDCEAFFGGRDFIPDAEMPPVTFPGDRAD